jgi:hypothetical protein
MSKFYTSEFDIQVAAERMMDLLDIYYLQSDMTQEEYDLRVEEINQWEQLRYREMKETV